MDLNFFLDRVTKITTLDDDDDDFEDKDEGEDTEGEKDIANTIICPSCGEDLNIVDEEELFEGAELICDSCGAQMEVTGFDKSTPILKQIEEQK